MAKLKNGWLLLLFLAVIAWVAGCTDKDSGQQVQKSLSEKEQLKQSLNIEKLLFEKEKEEILQQLRQQQAQIEHMRTELTQLENELQTREQELKAREAQLKKFRATSWVIFILGLALLIGGIAILVRYKSVQVVKEVIKSNDLRAESTAKPEPPPVTPEEPIQPAIVSDAIETQVAAEEPAPEVSEEPKPKRTRKRTRKPKEPEA